ncbi:serine O-acetyltransferase EpsC [Parasphingopyxis marina]|uniref:Serine acetyltransferase n=1 Tax=Parasphingopyxis marina TaxID=2761622 RepID=A0A842HXW5_9SPHN|nr:serine O-acetyltransferase EpsC [Parasphingopyxis marina]MBC2777293.1 serine acetyltransferase [Parasphingopyxis marina]
MANRLIAYLDSIKARDPAPRSRMEVLLYPGVAAFFYHRIAHRLFRMRLFFLARLVNHWSRFVTAIDIHPGARIGHRLFIDHGFSVIGETAEIGDNVTIYQCVTLGGTNPADGVAGKRHPTIEDDVIIGSGAQVLGPITVGKGARIGANAVVTKDVPPGAVMVGIPAKATLMDAQDKPEGFVPYGTPCSEMFDPSTQRLELMRCELEAMRKQIDALIAERDEREERDEDHRESGCA